jgi:hypothetical protein
MAVGTKRGKGVAIRKSLRVIGIAVELREESRRSLAEFREVLEWPDGRTPVFT